MCLAIFKPASANISYEALHQGWISNSDGAGYAFTSGKKLVVRKGFMKWLDFWEAYRQDKDKAKASNFVIHFRIRSMGDRSADNTHPFEIKGGVLIHNGSLTGTGAEYNRGKSDTCIFTEKYGNALTYANVETHKEEIEKAIGHNKMVLLYKDGRHHIVNERDGHWHDGAWWSNSSYRGYGRGAPTPSSSYSGVYGMYDD